MDTVDTISSYGKEAASLFADLSIATLITIATVTVLFVYSLRYGKDKIIALIISMYVSIFVYIHFPYKEVLSIFTGSDLKILLSNAIIFIALLIIVYIIIERIVWAEYSEVGTSRFVEAGVLSVAASALLLAFAFNILGVANLYNFAAPIEQLFNSSDFFFWWLTLPLVSILFFVKK